MTVLTGTTVLLLVLSFYVNRLGDLLTVSELGNLKANVQTKAALKSGGQNRKVHIAQAIDKELLGFGIVLKADGVVFLYHLGNTLRDLALVALGNGNHNLYKIRCGVRDLRIAEILMPSQGIVCIGG